MISKILGAVLIMAGSVGFAVTTCAAYKREVEMLRQLIRAVDFLQCELQYRMTPLPELCEQAGNQCKGRIGLYFRSLATELSRQIAPDVAACSINVLGSIGHLPQRVDKALEILSASLGQFDVPGQLQSLAVTRNYCRSSVENMTANQETNLRTIQTLGICAGTALVILLV